MKDTNKIEDLISQSKRDKINVDFNKASEYNDITKKLENEKVLKFSDLTSDELKIINVEEDLKEFDYFNEAKKELTGEEQVVKPDPKVEIKEIDKSNGPLIVFDNVHLKYGRDEVINGITLKIYPGEFVYFVGKSGAGKSSLIKMIYREVLNTSGKVIVDRDNITKYKNRRMPYLRRKIGVIFQDYKLLPNKTVYENVLYSLEVTGYKKSLRKNKVLDTLKRVGIIDKKDKFPDELSGGQQQRVAIARAIVDDPLIVVADEPTGNLDPENAIGIMEILQKINANGTTVVMATHDVGIVNKYSRRVILLGDGNIVKESLGGYIYE